MGEELGNDLMLPLGLTLLAEGVATEWDDALSSSTPMAMDSPWPAPSESPQSHPTYIGGAQPKVPAKPSTCQSQLRSWSRPKEGPDHINCPHRWISGEMSRLLPTTFAGGRRLKPVGGPSRGHTLWRKATVITRSNTMCYCRQQSSGCQLPSRRPLGGVMPHPRSAGFALKILCLSLMPLAPRTSGSWGKRRPWPGPRHDRPVLKNLGPQQAFYVTPCKSIRDVWPPDDSMQGQHSAGLPPETHRRGTWYLPHNGGGSLPPGQWDQTTTSPRLSPRTTGNPWVHRTCQVNYHS